MVLFWAKILNGLPGTLETFTKTSQQTTDAIRLHWWENVFTGGEAQVDLGVHGRGDITGGFLAIAMPVYVGDVLHLLLHPLAPAWSCVQ